jgi:hypothetical protein
MVLDGVRFPVPLSSMILVVGAVMGVVFWLSTLLDLHLGRWCDAKKNKVTKKTEGTGQVSLAQLFTRIVNCFEASAR